MLTVGFNPVQARHPEGVDREIGSLSLEAPSISWSLVVKRGGTSSNFHDDSPQDVTVSCIDANPSVKMDQTSAVRERALKLTAQTPRGPVESSHNNSFVSTYSADMSNN